MRNGRYSDSERYYAMCVFISNFLFVYFNSNFRKFLCIPQLQIVLDYKSGLNPSNKNTQNPWSETRISKVNKKNTCIGLNGIFDFCEESLFYVGYVMSALIAVRGGFCQKTQSNTILLHNRGYKALLKGFMHSTNKCVFGFCVFFFNSHLCCNINFSITKGLLNATCQNSWRCSK